MDIKIIIALLAIPITVALLVFYKKVLNPLIVLTPDPSKMAKCPDRWNFNSDLSMCEPAYKTECKPFNPNTPMLNTAQAKCNLARSCNTTWSGLCG